jgi:alanyl-tRNA synthetase
MKSSEVRRRFLAFFKNSPRNHAIIASAPLVPENDPSVLFNTAGMQPLVPYLMGEKHPAGTRLANIQKCVRTGDIDDIGDNTHATFFEMMGNWSLGDYFKKEAIEWSFELLTNKEEGFGLDPRRLYVTCYQGDDIAPKDDESADVWRDLFEKAGIEGERIYFLGADANWWPAVKKSTDAWSGPTGPCTEMFYDMTGNFTEGMTKEEFLNKSDITQELVEIWNDVFMEYVKKDGVITGKLENKNVDTGSGFERISAVLQGTTNIFDTDVFMPICSRIRELRDGAETKEDTKAIRIVADHMRAAVMLISDGVLPANTDQGYILRRLIRRAVRFADVLKLKPKALFHIADIVCDYFADIYENVAKQRETIKIVIDKEEQKFRNTLNRGLKELMAMIEKTKAANEALLNSEDAFLLYESYGFPIELTTEICKEHGISIDMKAFAAALEKHQELSRAGAGDRFKGGLGDNSEISVRYHTATHLLHQALREVLGDHVTQKGSNITPERLRFDFAHTTKMTDEEKKRVEDIVNEKIDAALPVQVATLSKEDAEKTGALHFFGEKYGDSVTVYFVGDSMDTAFSKEFCGGPHVKNTSELAGRFKIAKEEAIAQGVRRIKAILS